jgi:hypothetical protein
VFHDERDGGVVLFTLVTVVLGGHLVEARRVVFERTFHARSYGPTGYQRHERKAEQTGVDAAGIRAADAVSIRQTRGITDDVPRGSRPPTVKDDV